MELKALANVLRTVQDKKEVLEHTAADLEGQLNSTLPKLNLSTKFTVICDKGLMLVYKLRPEFRFSSSSHWITYTEDDDGTEISAYVTNTVKLYSYNISELPREQLDELADSLEEQLEALLGALQSEHSNCSTTIARLNQVIKKLR